MKSVGVGVGVGEVCVLVPIWNPLVVLVFADFSKVLSGTSSVSPSSDPSSDPSSTPSRRSSSTHSAVPSSILSTNPLSVQSALPSVTPSLPPISTPSTAPSVSPSSYPSSSLRPSTCDELNECGDSPLMFNTRDLDGEGYKSTCSSVNELPNKLDVCELRGVSIHCPVTCEACSDHKDSDSILGTFYGGLIVDNKEWFRCKEINETNFEHRCFIPGVSQTCRTTCDPCALSYPSGLPSESPSISTRP